MEQLNKVELIGIVGQCNTTTIHDRQVARFVVATQYAYRDEEGQPVIETSWHVCSTTNAPEGLRKGAKVKILGRLRIQSSEDKGGETRYFTEIVAKSVEIL